MTYKPYTSQDVFNVIEQIAGTSSKNEKVAILTRHKDDPVLQRVLLAALDPGVTFGVSGVVAPPTIGYDNFDGYTETILNNLRDRTLTGNAAREAIDNEMMCMNPESAQLFARILNKDLRAGISESTVNKVIPKLIPEYPYMRCSLPKAVKLDKWPWASGVISQEKADGMYVSVDLHPSGQLVMRTRAGTQFDISKFPGIEAIISRSVDNDTQIQGELLVVENGEIMSRELGNGVLNSILSGGDFEPGQIPLMKVWDQIPLEAAVAKGKCEVPYKARYEALRTQLEKLTKLGAAVQLIDTRFVYSLDEAYAHYRELLGLKKEGTIISNPEGIWKDGTSKDKVKLKLEVTVDLMSTKILPGKVGTKNEGRPGSLTMTSLDGLCEVDVTVKNETLRDAIEADPDRFINKVWAVTVNDIMEPSDSNPLHSLFLPRMAEAGYRIDKSTADTLQQIMDQFVNAVATA